MDDINFEILHLMADIMSEMEREKNKPDEEGFIFITNKNKKDMSLPFEFTRKYFGFKQPIFKIKEAKKRDGHDTSYMNGIWAKEGMVKVEE